jgi:hypothetical protein
MGEEAMSKFYHKDGTTSSECYPSKALHRTDGPAIEFADGGKEWWVDGKRHRVDGPACEYAEGSKYWYVNGKCHRVDGPAVEYANGYKEWWVNGSQPISLTKQLLINYMKLNNLTLAHLLTDPDDMLRKSAEKEVG